jgi:hypothetical protein
VANIKLTLDAGELTEMLKQYAAEIEQDMQKGIKNLAVMTHAHVLELAERELKSTKSLFKQNVSWSELAPGIYAVTIHSPAVWIDDGIASNTDMKPGLLKNVAPNDKGVRSRVIPLDQAQAPSQLTPPNQELLNELKQHLKEKKIPYKKLEMNSDGNPKLGRLHELNLGGRIPGNGNTPIFDGVNIYQTKNPKTGKVTRQITTFRTVSDGPGSDGKWIHPGTAPKNFLDRASVWAEQVWENQILPEILRKYQT